MQVSVETTQGLERRMTVALPSEDIDSAILERLQKLSKTARMNGFRPGKVPFKVVKKRFEPQVRSEVLGSMINDSYYTAVKQENLRPAGQPDIAPGETTEEDDAGFRFVATFEVYPEFEPVYNDSIKVTRPQVTIEESDIDEMVENLRKQRTEFNTVDRASQDGDQIVIDFTGRLDGEEFEGGKAEKAPLTLGSSKETEFDITVHEVNEPGLPELDEELVRSFGIEDGTVESLRADIVKNMQRELKQRVDNQVKNQVMDGLVELNPIDVPAALIAEEVKRQKEQMLKQMPEGSEASALPDELFTEQAKRRVQLGLVVSEIIQQNNLTADAAAVRAQVELLASSYQDPQQVVDYYYGNEEMLRNVEGLVVEEAVTTAVLEAATVVDEPTSFKDIMNPPAPEETTESENT